MPNPVRKIMIGGAVSIAVSALGVTLMLPSNGAATMRVAEMAAIDESNTTLGFADSDMYGLTPAQIDAHLDEMQAMGVNNVRIMIPWAGVQPTQTLRNWAITDYMVNAADTRGMGILAVLNSTPSWAVTPGQPVLSSRPNDPAQFGSFAGEVAARYAGKVGAYEIWNEPNGFQFYRPQPDPAGYTELLKAAYPTIKASDPDATVVGGVLGAVVDYGTLTMNPVKFVNGIYANGGGAYFDALSYHPYQYTRKFSLGGNLPESPINQLTAMRNIMVANGDSTKQIWASEYGEPSSVAGEQNQADFTGDMITKWRTLDYTGPAFIWTLQDRNTGSSNNEDNFGVIRTDGTWKPAAYVIQQLAQQPQTMQLAASMSRMALAAPATEATVTSDAIPLEPTDPATLPAPDTPMQAAADAAAMGLDAGATAVANALAAVSQAVTSTAPQPEEPAPSSVPETPTPADAVTSTTQQIARQAEEADQQAEQTGDAATGATATATSSADQREQKQEQKKAEREQKKAERQQRRAEAQAQRKAERDQRKAERDRHEATTAAAAGGG